MAYGFLGIVLVWSIGSSLSAARHDFDHFELEFISAIVMLILGVLLFRPSDAPVLVSNNAVAAPAKLDHLVDLLEELLEAGPDDNDIWRSWLAKADKGLDDEGRDRLDLLGDRILVAMADLTEASLTKIAAAIAELPTRVVHFGPELDGGYVGRHEGFGAAGAELGTPAALEAPTESLVPADPPQAGKRTLGLLETDPPAGKAPAKKASAKKAAPAKKAAKKVGSGKAPARL